jgi:ATP-dependent Clp protease ATP-binding subunit ClpB
VQLKIEREALKKDKDKATLQRLENLEQELAELEKEYSDYEEQWTAEKLVVQGSSNLKEELEAAKLELESAHRAGDLARMSELQYGLIPELESQISQVAEAELARDHKSQLLRNQVGSDEVAEIVSRWTGIPVSKMLEGEQDKLLRMEEEIGKQVVGQQEAVAAVANAIRRSRAGLSDPSKPNGSFMFFGPTGVGKTELTKALANFMFDSDDAMVRLDMSEYMEKHAVSRLIGAPPGYVGYEEGGHLTEAVRRKPYSVILLDEIEKAHPDVFNILLQVLDDGRLTDSQGRTVDFRNTVIIMTSNLGSQQIQEMSSNNDYDGLKRVVMEIVSQHFRPEFINRVDETVVFHPLAKDQIRDIAKIQLHQLAERLHDQDFEMQISDEAVDVLGEAGFDPVYGARPLKRAIQQYLENPLAQMILKGEYMPGDVININASNSELVFVPAERVQQAG